MWYEHFIANNISIKKKKQLLKLKGRGIAVKRFNQLGWLEYQRFLISYSKSMTDSCCVLLW